MSSVRPIWAVAGGRVAIEGQFPVDHPRPPEVRMGDAVARAVTVSSRVMAVLVPEGVEGRVAIRINGLSGETPFVEVGASVAAGLHQVDNPVFDAQGNLYVTYSGARGQQTPVSIFRVPRSRSREPFASGIVNATSMAFDTRGRLHVSSRFEGCVYRVEPDGRTETVASDLGAPCGLAFAEDDSLFVGDRSGTIFHLRGGGDRAMAFASLPPSVAAFHLAYGPDRCLYATAPTLSSYDHVYRIDGSGRPEIIYSGFGRPQGLTFDLAGSLYVVEALAGASGLYRLSDGRAELVVSGAGLVGVAMDPRGGLIVASNETAYRLEVGIRGRS